jgi:hypothetical protein
MRARIAGALALTLVLGLSACGGGGFNGFGDDGHGRMLQQARDHLARWEAAVAAAGGMPDFVPIGETYRQVGNWEQAVGENNKPALYDGKIELVVPNQPASALDTVVRWDDGRTENVTTMSAAETIAGLRPPQQSCPECTPLRVTAARPVTMTMDTTHGPATAPAWEFTVDGTAVKVLALAVAPGAQVRVTPPSWDPYNPPGGLAIDSASVDPGGSRLTAYFIGAGAGADKPCGADYTAEAVESAHAVVVIVNTRVHSGQDMCTLVGYPRQASVDLAAPLNGRAVLEVVQGLPVKVTYNR